MDRAAKARKDFNDKLAAKKKAARNKRDSSETTGLLCKLSDSQIQALTADQLMTLISTSNNESPIKKSRADTKDIHTFVVVFEAKEAISTTGAICPSPQE
jgi:hypothetical protein